MPQPSRLPPIIDITLGTFYRSHPNTVPASRNPPLFKDLSFAIPSTTDTPAHWCVVGPSLSGKTTFLQVLAGRHLCFPPGVRKYPYLATEAVPPRLRVPNQAIRYVGFGNDGNNLSDSSSVTASAYLSARYESKRENTDFSLRDFLLGNTELNALKACQDDGPDLKLLDRVVAELKLSRLLDLPVAFLSNGQGRRASIARSLLTSPELLLLDEPFMGLDPPTVASLSNLLHGLASKANPRLVLSARPQDPIPHWITHLVYLTGDCQIGAMGDKGAVLEGLNSYVYGVRTGNHEESQHMPVHNIVQMGKTSTANAILGEETMEDESLCNQKVSGDTHRSARNVGEPLVEMDGCQVQYQGKIALGDWSQPVNGGEARGLRWTVRRGERWGIFGPNGSGKTTIVSLICSDHPQTYSMPIKLFGRSRLPEPGSGKPPLTFWDIQSRIGHSSPEIHRHMPRNLTVRQVIENAWADTFRSKASLDTKAKDKVDACLQWFEPELNPVHVVPPLPQEPPSKTGREKRGQVQGRSLEWADNYMFGEIAFSAQRVALFLRAIVKSPEVVVLDEAFSGMDDGVRNRCLLFLEYGETKKCIWRDHGPGTVVENNDLTNNDVKLSGLTDHQALVCISHVREEIPNCIREWICLPEPNTGEPPRFGVSHRPLGRDKKTWAEIWGIGPPSSAIAQH